MAGIFEFPLLAAKEAIAFFRGKGFRVGFDWRDVWQEEHVKAFTVAKAMSIDLLEDIRSAIDDPLEQGESLEEFTKQLRPKLQKRGWWGRRPVVDPATGQHVSAQLGSDRRLKTIYQVNMRSAYQAGRWQRIVQTKAMFPWVRYTSIMDGREREEHHAWHGTILPVDHPWWNTHYPPCGWGCRCTATSLNERTMARRGWKPTEKPIVFPSEPYENKRSGEIIQVERGIDPGFSYNVGKAYLETLAPSPLPESFGGDEEVPASAGATVEAAIGGFLAAFDIGFAKEKIFLDVDGWPLPISAGWFRGADGVLRLPAGGDRRALALVGRAIADPDSWGWVWVRDLKGRACLMRRYRRGDLEVDVGRIGWRFRIGDARVAAAFNPRQARDRYGRWTTAFNWIGHVLDSGQNRKGVVLGKVTDAQAGAVAELGIDIRGKTLVLDASQVLHINKRHNLQETRKLHRKVAPVDIADAFAIFGGSTFSKADYRPETRFVGRMRRGDVIMWTLWERRKHSVALFSMWIREE